MSCVISYFYIKPQPDSLYRISSNGCVISYFYIKPQPVIRSLNMKRVVLYLTSTSNHNYNGTQARFFDVVLYLTSTSNHNLTLILLLVLVVVLYLTSTSNHNMLIKPII